MNVIDRFLKTFAHEEPDHVPSFVQGIMEGFIEQWARKYDTDDADIEPILTPLKDCTVHVHLGFESSWCGFPGPSVTVSEIAKKACQRANERLPADQKALGYSIAQNGSLRRTTILPNGRPHGWQVEGTLNTRELWEDFYDGYAVGNMPANSADLFNQSLKEAVKHDFLVIPSTGLLSEPLIGSVGIGGMGRFARKDPAFFRQVLDTLMKPTYAKMAVMCESDAPLIIVPDDCAYKGRPIMSPAMYEAFILPHLKRMVDMAHRVGKKIFLHSDGFIEPYYPLFIKIGLDGHQSLEPAAGMDLKHLKQTYGDMLVLIGNMDCSRLLPYGTSAEVGAVAKKCLEDGKSGGGYVFSPCTDLTDSCTLENAETMMKVYKEYRVYKK